MKEVSATLEEQGFTQEVALNHKELIPFVAQYLFRKNIFTIGFLILNIVFLVTWLAICIIQVYHGTLSLGKIFTWSAYGCALVFLLVPFHEGLHGMAYRMCGAKKVSYKANWKKLYFMAIADRFIAGRKSFYFIGLTPFVLISTCLILLCMLSPSHLQVMWLMVLWVHASMCAGDFGLLSYFEENNGRDVVTYDDATNAISYFYSRGR
jgi:Putative zincin peptidase